MTLHEEDGMVVVEPQGHLYEGTECDAMERALSELAERGRRVIVDLSGAQHLTARCLGILAHVQEVAARHGGRLVVCATDPRQRWLLTATGLATPLGVAVSRAAAIREMIALAPA